MTEKAGLDFKLPLAYFLLISDGLQVKKYVSGEKTASPTLIKLGFLETCDILYIDEYTDIKDYVSGKKLYANIFR